VRIAPSSTNAPNPAIAALPAAGLPGITFQAALANSSGPANANDTPIGNGSKAHGAADIPNRPASKQNQERSPSDNIALTAAPVPLVDRNTASANDSSGEENDSVRTISDSSQTAADPQFAVALSGLSPQIGAAPEAGGAAPQPAVGAEEHPVLQEFDVPAVQSQPAPHQSSLAAAPIDIAFAASPQTNSPQAVLNAATQPGAGIPAQAAGPSIAAQTVGENLKLQIELPIAALPKGGDSIQSSNKAAQRNSVDTAGAKSSDTAKSTSGWSTDAVSPASESSSHNTQSNGQSPQQHSQTDAAQATAAAMAKPIDSSAAQAQPIPILATPHQAAPAAAGLQDAAHPALDRAEAAPSALDADEPTAASGINTARVIQTMGETEMRVGMQSAEFGSISIRTSVSQQQMSTQISLEHSDLSQAIAAHIPEMQARLGADYGLHTSIQVSHLGASSSGEQDSPSQREQRAFTPSAQPTGAAIPVELDVGVGIGITAAAQLGASDGYRLDIRA
jgi:hypothetical protein